MLLLALLGTGGCMKNPFARETAAKESDKKQEAAVPVEVAPIQRGPIETFVKKSTPLEADQEVKVFARTSNRIVELLVEEGQKVEKGQLLLRLDDDIQKTAYQKALSNAEKARKEFERSRVLYTDKLISEQAFTDIQFELRQLELALEDALRQLEYTRVTAPIAGTVTRRLVKLGELVNVNHHLFDIIDFNSIVARVYVPENELSRLELDQPVRVSSTALPGIEHTGYVQLISPIVETKTGTVKVTVAFKEVGRLRPGMYVDVEIITAQREDALLISKRSLVYDGDQIYAFRLKPDVKRVERLLIEPLLADKENVQPAKGFKEGDLIVLAGQTGLKDGALVRLPGDPIPEDKKTEDGKKTASTQSSSKQGGKK